jgi:membrane-bound lytic murein transglycosylase F
MYNSIIKTFVVILIILSFSSCSLEEKKDETKRIICDFEQIQKRGKLIVATQYNSTDYFIYRGQPMGYQIELLQLLSDDINIPIEIKVDNDLTSCFEGLNKGKYDLLAVGLTITNKRKDTIKFTLPINKTKQVLVQRKPDNWRNMRKSQINDSIILSPVDLGGKTIYIEKGSSFLTRLNNLQEEIGEEFIILEDSERTVEELITMVANGEIDYTISDKNIALVNKTYYTNLDISVPISLDQNVAWAIRPHADSLKMRVNNWITAFKKTRKYKSLYTKYYKNSRSTNKNMEGFLSSNDGKISNYDEIVKVYADEINWDWRLLSSLIYQESRFNNNVQSWAGAFGLMQLMPATAERFGVDSLASANANIQAGVRFIKWLDRQFVSSIPDTLERQKFILASYNVGLGHVQDAQRLAEKNGKNRINWNDVSYYLLNKSKPKYYQDPVVKYGYCRGSEPYYYVSEIIDRFQHYKNLVDTPITNNK